MKNPNRVLSGQINRAKRGHLSDQAREKLRQAALRNQPWLNSTGPRTELGKSRSASNLPKRKSAARDHSMTAVVESARALLALVRQQ